MYLIKILFLLWTDIVCEIAREWILIRICENVQYHFIHFFYDLTWEWPCFLWSDGTNFMFKIPSSLHTQNERIQYISVFIAHTKLAGLRYVLLS